MSLVATLTPLYAFQRQRTLDLLDKIAADPQPAKILGWRPGPGRAHIGWQLMHVAVTEEIFATERLAPERPGQWMELWPRYRGGSTPDDQPPSVEQLREVLAGARARLLETLAAYGDDRLQEIPPALAARQLTVEKVLYILAWHEAHHQGQAHSTLNLYRAAEG